MNSYADSPVHVLLVEQDDSILELFSTLLCANGYVVSTARGGLEALDLVSIAAPHIVFTSLVFDDIDGFELCRRLRSRPQTSTSLVVALTGYSQAGIKEKVHEAGFDHYLLKPVSIHVLLSLIESYVPQRTLENANRQQRVLAAQFQSRQESA